MTLYTTPVVYLAFEHLRRRVRRVRKYRTQHGNPAAGNQAAKDTRKLRDLGSRLRFWSEDSRNPRYPKESS